jgi:hypothetical protein
MATHMASLQDASIVAILTLQGQKIFRSFEYKICGKKLCGYVAKNVLLFLFGLKNFFTASFFPVNEISPLLYFYLWIWTEKLTFPNNPTYLKNFL